MAELYEIATILKSSADAFSDNPDIWKKYFIKVQNKIYKEYHPNLLRWKELSNKESKSLYLTIMLDKNGNILSYQYNGKGNIYQNPKLNDKDFDTKFEYHVKKIFDKTKFPPLPKQYKGDKLILRFNISFNTKEDNSSYKEIYKGGGSTMIMLEKNSSPAITVPIYIVKGTKDLAVLTGKGAKGLAVFTGKAMCVAVCVAGVVAGVGLVLLIGGAL